MNGAVPPCWLLVAATAAAAASGAHAEELRFEPSAGTYGEFNDNPNMGTSHKEPVVGIVADAGLRVSWSGVDRQWGFAPRVIARRYDGETDLNSRDLFVDASYTRAAERFQYRAGFAYAREYTLTGQFAATGVTDQNLEQQSTVASLAGTYLLSERLSTETLLSLQDVNFSGDPNSGVTDYKYLTLRAHTDYQLGERTSTNLILRLGRLDSKLADSGEFSVGVGMNYAWNERWRTSVAIGPSWSAVEGRDRTVTTSYRVTLDGAWERSSLQFGAERLLSPLAAQGKLQTRDALFASLNRRFTPTLDARAFVSGELYYDVGTRDPATDDSNGTFTGGVALSWRPAEAWTWNVSYSHTLRDAEDYPSANIVTAGFAWTGRARTSSH